MKKKVLIASFFAAIMLIVSFTAVAGSSSLYDSSRESEEDKASSVELTSSVQPPVDIDLSKLSQEELIAEAQAIVATLSREFGNDPAIADICLQATAILTSISTGIDCGKLDELAKRTNQLSQLAGGLGLDWLAKKLGGLSKILRGLHDIFCPFASSASTGITGVSAPATTIGVTGIVGETGVAGGCPCMQ